MSQVQTRGVVSNRCRFSFVCGFALACGGAAAAATITVGSAGGPGDGNGCTLAEAIDNANNAGQIHPDCAPGTLGLDTIGFAPALTAGGPAVIKGWFVVRQELTIDGPGADLLSIGGDGDGHSTFVLEPGADSMFEGLTLSRGFAANNEGGAIFAAPGADLTLAKVRVVGNSSASNGGGGIYVVDADLTVIDSEISGNTAFHPIPQRSSVAGGLWFVSEAASPTRTLSLTNVTVSGNASNFGGGMIVQNYGNGAQIVANLHHVTFSANEARITTAAGGVAGGLYLLPHGQGIVAHLVNVAFGDNSAPVAGPDIFEEGDTTLTLSHSVVETTGGYTPDSWVPGPLNADPGLTPLACNGGPTLTSLLLPTSPAIDLVPAADCSLAADQRGQPRPVDGDGDTVARCDAGAVEHQAADNGRRSFYTLAPCRIVDTRGPAGPFGGPSLDGGENLGRVFTVAGRCGVPATAVAIAANVTAVNATAAGSLRLGGLPTVHYPAGATRANNAVVTMCPSFEVLADQPAGSTVDFVLDVVGYFD